MRRVNKERIGMETINFQGCTLKIIEYNSRSDIVVEFQDEYKGKVHTQFGHFLDKSIKNPYYPEVYGVGIIGTKYRARNIEKLKEYICWHHMIQRCYDHKTKEKNPSYKDAICCDEWLLYENFYEWLHSQENFEKWLNGERWALDKDILIKNNKTYSPDTCCLVPQKINSLFTKRKRDRGNYPIGVSKHNKKYRSLFSIDGTCIISPVRNTPEDAFYLDYKPTKEFYIKQVAQEEYDLGNITKRCYEAMMNYKVEITD